MRKKSEKNMFEHDYANPVVTSRVHNTYMDDV
jgi:hypothetical protein